MEGKNVLEDIASFVGEQFTSGFRFDDVQNGYISDGSEIFVCSDCKKIPDPVCDCGISWNIYEVVLDGVVKTIARQVETSLIEHRMTR